MTNKELEVIVCNAIDARKEQGTPFDRDAFAALVKMAQALSPYDHEHQIDVVARMKSIVDPIDGFHPAGKRTNCSTPASRPSNRLYHSL
ncbi:MAG: hypothetical protein ACLSHC_12445 [Bilophila wadsworthia]